MQRVVQIEAVCPGKSTVLRVFTGYLPPSEGAVHVGGYDALEHPLEIRKHVGYVPEDAPLYDGMRVLAGKRTVIVASHVLTEIDKLATRVMILREGELLTADAMAEAGTAPRLRLRVSGPLDVVLSTLRRVSGVVSADAVTGGDETLADWHDCLVEVSHSGIAQDLGRAVVNEGFALSELVL